MVCGDPKDHETRVGYQQVKIFSTGIVLRFSNAKIQSGSL
jgi:hypothetical protein